jgi:predicted nucleic acid-binding protein
MKAGLIILARRSPKLAAKLTAYMARFAGRILAFDAIDSVICGSLMGQVQRRGVQISTADGMIA